MELQKLRKEFHHRKVTGVLMVLRTPPFNHCGFCLLHSIRIVALDHILSELSNQPRLSKPCVSDEQNDLAEFIERLLPAILQNMKLCVSSDQRSQIARIDQFHPIAGGAFAEHSIDFDRLRSPSQSTRTERLALEEQRSAVVSRRADQDHSGFGKGT